MRMTLPQHKCFTVRSTSDGQLRLVRRRLNQNPTYFVILNGEILHMGSYKWCNEKFNSYLGTNETYNWFSSN